MTDELCSVQWPDNWRPTSLCPRSIDNSSSKASRVDLLWIVSALTIEVY